MSYKHLFISPEQNIKTIIRVDHAGELGAKQIYLGQLKALPECREILEMLETELKHLEFFESEIHNKGYTPSFFNPIWSILAFLTGFLSAKLGYKTAMLCTYKIEEVIEQHYAAQINCLEEGYLKNTLIDFRKDEISHMDSTFTKDEINGKLALVFSLIAKIGIAISTKL